MCGYRGSDMEATAAKEAASEWIRMDSEGSGERTHAAREAAPRGEWGNGTCWRAGVAAARRATVEATAAATATTVAWRRGVVSPISSATRGQKGCEYESTRTHPLSP